MAAKHNCTIVPFAAVGVDDSLNMIADARQLGELPVVGEMLKARAGGVPQVRWVGVGVGGEWGGPRCTVGLGWAGGAQRCSLPRLRHQLNHTARHLPPWHPAQARQGVSAGAEEESFISPLVAPKLPPGRMYFVFQQPIQTCPEDLKVGARSGGCLGWGWGWQMAGQGLTQQAGRYRTQHPFTQPPLAPCIVPPTCRPHLQDRARCDELYAQTKASVEQGISYLLDQRQADPFGEFLPRQLWEAVNRGRQAPTFPLN